MTELSWSCNLILIQSSHQSRLTVGLHLGTSHLSLVVVSWSC